MLLKHKILIKRNDFIETIEYEQPSFSLDGRKFSCVVSHDYKIATGDIFMFHINGLDQVELEAVATDYIEQGYADIEKTYKLLNFSQEIEETVYEGESETRKWYYFIGDNGCIQSGFDIGETDEEGNPILYFTELDTLTSKTYRIKNNTKDEEDEEEFILDSVTLPIRHYIKNGFIQYNDTRYFRMLYDENGDIADTQDLWDDYTIFPKKRKQKDWKRRTKLEFTLPNKYTVPLDTASCGTLESFVVIKGEEYVMKETWDEVEVSDVKRRARVRYVEIDGETYDEKSNTLNDDGSKTAYPWEYSNILEYEGEEYIIQQRFVASKNGQYIILYIDSDVFSNSIPTSFITAQRLKPTLTAFCTNKGYKVLEDELGNYLGEDSEYVDLNTVTIDGYDYPVTTVERLEFDGYHDLYQANENNEKTFYIVLSNGKRVYFRKESDYNYVLLDNLTTPYASKDFNKLTYNGLDYYKEVDEKEGDSFKEHPFVILHTPTFKIQMVAFTEPNMFIGQVKTENDADSLDRFENTIARAAHADISRNYTYYTFTTDSAIFFEDKTQDKNLIDIFNTDNIGPVELPPYVVVERSKNEIQVPIHLCTLHGTNLFQEDLVKKDFVSDNAEKAINPIVDMEKDIYYPMILNPTNNISDENIDDNLIDATQVQFNLHLRTRDDEWNVKEDTLGDFKGIYKVDTEITPAQIEEGKVYNTFFTKASWNIFDYYEEYYNKILNDIKSGGDKPEFYYPPSDLLGFFDFTDDDIYYQKSKIKKTFLRLYFFDSKNPQTQSLLGTSTIFMDTGAMFGKFSDKNANPDENLRYVSPITWDGKTNYISGMREPVEKRFIRHNQYNPEDVNPGFIEFKNEDERMTSQMIVDNKFLTETSAEGFYAYLFREFSSKLHERTIYMKIQLNHAGHGTVLDMLQPMVKDENGVLSLAKISEIDKNGMQLKELYDMMYIPIKVKYNFKMKKYCWYLPQELVKHSENKIIFNLFEIKISNHAPFKKKD